MSPKLEIIHNFVNSDEYAKPVVLGSKKEYADYVVTKKADCYVGKNYKSSDLIL